MSFEHEHLIIPLFLFQFLTLLTLKSSILKFKIVAILLYFTCLQNAFKSLNTVP